MQHQHATSTTFDVLRAVALNLKQSEFAQQFGYSRSQSSRIFKRVARYGLIHREYRTSHVVWSLTADGQRVLLDYRRGMPHATSTIFRWEHLFFKSEWRVKPRGLEERLTQEGFVFAPRHNYGGWEWKEESVTVFVTSKSVWFLVRPVVADTIAEALNKGLAIVGRARADFEAKFGCRLGYPERVSVLKRQELAMIGGMTEFFPKGFFKQGERLKIDASTGVPELETVHKAFAIEDMERIYTFQDAVARGLITVASAGGSKQLDVKERDWRDLV